jgi:hypothetical protein
MWWIGIHVLEPSRMLCAFGTPIPKETDGSSSKIHPSPLALEYPFILTLTIYAEKDSQGLMLLRGCEDMLSFRIHCAKTLFAFGVEVDANRRKMSQNNHTNQTSFDQALHS